MKTIEKGAVTRDNIVEKLVHLFDEFADVSYDQEPVTLREHMLQCAEHAARAGKDDALIAASLLHDIGHLLHNYAADAARDGIDTVHEEVGADFLADHFPDAVVEPIRLHVAAKRYLCATEPSYFNRLSEASVHSLNLQGGAHTNDEAAAFAANPHAEAAVWLRRFDEAGKVAGAACGSIRDYVPMLQALLR